jgi:sugar phosphate isomerase/epimerase
MYMPLPKSYRGSFPFSIGTTSFIYPAQYAPNVKALGPFLDEIELLFFESTAESSLPSKGQVKELEMLATEFNLSYNIHLPVDIFPGDHQPGIRHKASETISRVMDLVANLSPTTHTLHLPYTDGTRDKDAIRAWQERNCETIRRVLSNGAVDQSISIENLDYPYAWAQEVVRELNLSICLDVGHLLVQKIDPLTLFEACEDAVSIIHLHGVDGDDDHLGLESLDRVQVMSVRQILSRFKKTVSVEVFSYEHLVSSLKCMEAWF